MAMGESAPLRFGAPKPTEPVRTPSASNEMQRTAQPAPPKAAEAKPTAPAQPKRPGYTYPEVHTSNVDVNVNPVWDPAGKPITEVDIDADLAEHDKPWRRPGADQSDYFNYGFDEFTWTTYTMKQNAMANALKEQKAESANFERMFGGGAPGLPGAAGTNTSPYAGGVSSPAAMSAAPGMAPGMYPGMPDMSPDDLMAAMGAHMRAQGISDPNQLDFGEFMKAMGMPGGGGAGGTPQPPAGPSGQTAPNQQGVFGGGGPYGGGGGSFGRGGGRGRRW
ncbi:Fip1 motif-domain-containing protein [Lineolata rhizophorae]|uniref:Fip1 motif-domain-containing protein n=1 Tax=Lineolata rhizophorae TaxID=578093 RepID=A0A6A6P5H9_9PEZI|nr:Fip1 motif-domain-containing protein [Lineolata rhizophorae]